MIVSDGVELLIITGSGDVLERKQCSICRFGGNFALAAARAFTRKKEFRRNCYKSY